MKIKEMTNVGSSKYVVNYSDGTKTHPDGSEFRDIAIFKSKKKKDEFIKSLSGYQKTPCKSETLNNETK